MNSDDLPEGDDDRAQQALDSDPWPAFGVEEIPYRLLLLTKMIERQSAGLLRSEAGMTLAEWRIMAHLGYFGTMTVSEVSRSAYADRAEVSRAAALLEKRGTLARAPDPRNRRSQLLSLTAEGQLLFREIRELRKAYFHRLTSDLDDGMKATMHKALRLIAARLV